MPLSDMKSIGHSVRDDPIPMPKYDEVRNFLTLCLQALKRFDADMQCQVLIG
jgi:hypothetical protein